MNGSSFEQHVIDACVAVATGLLHDTGLPGTSHALVDETAKLSGFESVALSAVTADGALRLRSVTDERARRLDAFQLAMGAGPIIECWGLGHGWALGALSEAGRRWPAFRASAVGMDVGSMVTIAVRADGRALGVLSLYSTSTDVPSSAAVRGATALAAIGAVGLVVEQERAAGRREADTLLRASHDQIARDRAAGILAGVCGIGIDDALTALDNWAASRTLSPDTVARGIIARETPGLFPLVVAAAHAGSADQLDRGSARLTLERYDVDGKRVDQTVASDARPE
ncbi:hypothetical protein EV141_0203 [Microcella putealis]|uniref:ANTAR domain-containing protein n=1 Tax=Microcella putealis TaxID=337005 RepID=A0A4Q7LY90_9MICO|nr:hypothetical protein EV141_0203 [Microcella putealis]TQM24015.1 hypothetical protein BJ957_1482 [Microcella putealis]